MDVKEGKGEYWKVKERGKENVYGKSRQEHGKMRVRGTKEGR